MKIDIEATDIKNEIVFFIKLCGDPYNLLDDDKIAPYLNLSLRKYRSILIKHGGQKIKGYNDVYFQNKTDIKLAIEALIPYLIMANLTED